VGQFVTPQRTTDHEERVTTMTDHDNQEDLP